MPVSHKRLRRSDALRDERTTNLLRGDIRELGALLNGVQALNRSLPAKTTVRQLQVFLEIAYQNAKGRPPTLAELSQSFARYGYRGFANIKKNYRLFARPARDRADALNWIDVEADPSDRRKQRLVLNFKGFHALRSLCESMKSRPTS